MSLEQDIHRLLGQVEANRDGRQSLGPDDQDWPRGFTYASSLVIQEPQGVRLSRHERSPSLATSATSMSQTFDTSDNYSEYSIATTAPPLYGPEPAGRQRPMVSDEVVRWLPCEFRQYSYCYANFSLEDVNLWIDHIIKDHLCGHLPMYSICWFCDGTEAHFRPMSGLTEDKMECFRQRMYHIAGHFMNGQTGVDIRPDFHFLDHIHDHGLIDEATFQRQTQRGELPNRNMFGHAPRRAARRDMVVEERARTSRRRR